PHCLQLCPLRRRAAGRRDSGRRRFYQLWRANSPTPRAPQCRWQSRYQLHCQRQQQRVFASLAGGRQNTRGRQFHHLGNIQSQLYWPAQWGRHCGRDVQSRCQRADSFAGHAARRQGACRRLLYHSGGDIPRAPGAAEQHSRGHPELTYDGSTITWLRGGTSPEVAGVTFDTSDNGTDWTAFGAGERVAIAVGWQLTGVTLGSNTTVRARGLVAGGCYNGSGSFVEAGLGPPAIIVQPQDAMAHLNGSVTFGVAASGAPSLGYQWYKDGVAVAGGTSAWLTLN